MKVDVHLHHHASAEDRERGRYMAKSIAIIRETLDMISPKIQDALDRIRQTQSLAQASSEALRVQSGQISTLTDKVSELQAKLDAGGQISADDLAAIGEISNDIDQVNAQLQSAVPANTNSNQGQKASDGSSGVGAQTGGEGQPASASEPGDANAPTPPDPATQAQLDARADDGGAKPQPLAGTGAQ